jgi:hypothetical protein
MGRLSPHSTLVAEEVADMKGYSRACLGGAAAVEYPMFYNWAAGRSVCSICFDD